MNGASQTDWRLLLETRMKERVVPRPTDSRKEHELAVARRVAHLPRHERLAVWKEETGKSEPALYRRLEDVRRGDSQFISENQ